MNVVFFIWLIKHFRSLRLCLRPRLNELFCVSILLFKLMHIQSPAPLSCILSFQTIISASVSRIQMQKELKMLALWEVLCNFQSVPGCRWELQAQQAASVSGGQPLLAAGLSHCFLMETMPICYSACLCSPARYRSIPDRPLSFC